MLFFVIGSNKQPQETSLQYIKRILKTDINWSAWDFDSTSLAEQLTMVDKELFLKIPSEELCMLLWQQNTTNAPNISAIFAFSYRTSCLIASEILKDESEKTRARLLARFINVADKCHRISNFQSCRSVLSGLQSPAIYRLRRTWAYVRKKHASKYIMFEYLCRIYRDPRLPSYQKTFYIMSQNSPHLPYIGDIIVRLLNKVPDYQFQNLRRCTTKSHVSMQSFHQIENSQNLFTKILKAFTTTEAEEKRNQFKVKKN
ncbi:hypothetical protein NQ315_003324 [Exocentrus adspersus]|uniref:Ras-GEF domain-containing protein n=1 Tax=Exocentrus adspersus TaxID=1586481 RepID=A0AAV8VDE3_9CUCU|nr:hypothetical protein NQ315_003324 [Exocentrus adspersus]